jgi:hypothetical protein
MVLVARGTNLDTQRFFQRSFKNESEVFIRKETLDRKAEGIYFIEIEGMTKLRGKLMMTE